MQLASKVAAKAGDVGTALDAVDRIKMLYEVDSLTMSAEALVLASKSVSTKQAKELFIKRSLALVEDALRLERIDTANRLIGSLSPAVRRFRDSQFSAEVTRLRKRAMFLKNTIDVVKEQRKLLAVDPSDKKANRVVGKYYAFFHGHWSRGLPLLARCDDEQIKNLALAELKSDGSADKLAKAADGWWDLAKKEKSAMRDHILNHAVKLYRHAMPRLAGYAKTKALKRLDEYSASEAATRNLRSGDVLASDPHDGVAAGSTNTRDNQYTLDSPVRVPLYRTIVRYKIISRQTESTGDVYLSSDGVQWIRIGAWTPRLCAKAIGGDGWLTLSIRSLNRQTLRRLSADTPIKKFYIRFEAESAPVGAEVVGRKLYGIGIGEVQWRYE